MRIPLDEADEGVEAKRPLTARLSAGAAVGLRWAGGLLSIALIVGAVVWVYRLGVRDATELPVIQARNEPSRVRPEVQGGLEVANQGLEVNDVLAGTPPPELRPRERAPAPETLPPEDRPVAVVTPDATPDTNPAPEAAPQIAPQNAREAAPPVTERAELSPPPEPPAPDVSTDATPDAGPDETSGPAGRVEDEIDRLVLEALRAEQPPAPVAPSPRPRLRPRDFATRAATSPVSEALAPPPLAPPPLDPPRRTVAGPQDLVPGARLVQLGQFPTRPEARAAWSALVELHGDLLSQKLQNVEMARVDGRSFARLRALGFASFEEANALCQALLARGVDCVVGEVE